MDELRHCAELLYRATRVPAALTDGGGEQVLTWPNMPEGYVDSYYIRLLLDDFRLQKRDTLHPLVQYAEPGYLIGVAQLAPDRFCLLGPVSPVPRSRTDVLTFNNGAVPAEHLAKFCTMLLSAPLVDFERMCGLLCLLVRLACGAEVVPQNVLLCDNTSVRRPQDSALAKSLFTLREESELQHIPMSYEEEICAAVEAGDRDRLHSHMTEPPYGQVSTMSHDKLRQSRYLFVGFSALLARSAMRGGLSQETALSLSDIYCQRMDLLNDADEITYLMLRLAYDFCDRVNRLRKAKNYSPSTRRCIEYITRHLHEPIRLESLSKECGLCTRSLSLRFKQDTGMSIPHYIQSQRVEEARYLLTHSTESLSSIAAFLQYPTQSYFTKIFRQYTGMTPQQYRENPLAQG